MVRIHYQRTGGCPRACDGFPRVIEPIHLGVTAAFITIAKDIPNFHTAVLEKFVTKIAQVGAQSRSS
jgi:hypothetical protein